MEAELRTLSHGGVDPLANQQNENALRVCRGQARRYATMAAAERRRVARQTKVAAAADEAAQADQEARQRRRDEQAAAVTALLAD